MPENGTKLFGLLLVLAVNYRLEIARNVRFRQIIQWLHVKPNHPNHKPAAQLSQVY